MLDAEVESRRPARRLTGFTLAASLMAAVAAGWLSWQLLPPERDGSRPAPASVAATADAATAATTDVVSLERRAQLLEEILTQLPREGRVQRVGTASVISALEDRLLVVSDQLQRAQPGGADLQFTGLLRERVGLMQSLVQLRGGSDGQVWF